MIRALGTRLLLVCSAALLWPLVVCRGDEPPAPAAPNPAVAASMEKLRAIHAALAAYHKKNHQWPDQLSDLVPGFLPDAEALTDPADPRTGDIGSNQARKDSKFHVSYSYERIAQPSNGLPSPLGPFPPPDTPGTGWGTWRAVSAAQEYFYGDQVPLVRCFLHRPPEGLRDGDNDLVLNLTPTGRIYTSTFDWENHPDSIDHLLRTMTRDLAQSPLQLARQWYLFRVREHLGSEGDHLTARNAEAMRALAPILLAARDQLPDSQRVACHLAAVMYYQLGQCDEALAALDACTAYPGPDWAPLSEDLVRGRALANAGRWDDAISVFQSLVKRRPNITVYLNGLADALAGVGRTEEANEWRKKADPGEQLVGQPAPDFQVRRLDGETLTLAEARRGKKALLVNFWFCACGPCRVEFPHLQELHQLHSADGLAILAVNQGDSAETIGQFVSGRYTFPVALGKQGDEQTNPIFSAYRVTGYPTTYLIDADGKIVWRGVGFGREWLSEMPVALAHLGIAAKE